MTDRYFEKIAWMEFVNNNEQPGRHKIKQIHKTFNDAPSYDEIVEKQAIWGDIIERCDARMIQGYFRYGFVRKGKYNYIDEVIRRLKIYQKTGNRELLLDALNITKMEYVWPEHSNSHFEHVDDGTHATEKS
jgi:hypothetical protein